MAGANQNVEFNGLGTYTFTAAIAGAYFIDGKISLPTPTAGGGASSVLVTVNQNGSPIYTGVAGAQGFYTDMLLAAGDVITVVLSSSAPADQPLNVIKTQLSIGMGQ